MLIKKITILGKSDSVITMILDNLESNCVFPNIEIINNLNLPIQFPFDNPKYEISLVTNSNSTNDFILGVNKSPNKKKIVEYFNIESNKFINVFHKSVSISETTKLGNGCLFNSNVSIAAHSIIEDFVSINRNSSVGHHTLIENFVTIQPGCNICGFVNVGRGTIIGVGTNVLDGIKIGKNYIIGAGSLVTRDIPDNVVAYGSPCKIIRKNE